MGERRIGIMQTVLIIGGTESTRNSAIANHLNSWNISAFDRIMPGDELPSIGVAQIRTFIKKLSLAPQEGSHVAGIIAHGEKLTTEAQQALLKTLEEPPVHAYMIIAVANQALLLPTIISRCICLHLPEAYSEHPAEEFQKNAAQLYTMITASPGKQVAAISALGKSKDDLDCWIDTAIMTLRRILLEGRNQLDIHDTKKYTYLVHALMETRKYGENNVNLAQLLEHAFLSLP